MKSVHSSCGLGVSDHSQQHGNEEMTMKRRRSTNEWRVILTLIVLGVLTAVVIADRMGLKNHG